MQAFTTPANIKEIQFLKFGNSLHLKKTIFGFEKKKKRRVYEFSEIADLNQT